MKRTILKALGLVGIPERKFVSLASYLASLIPRLHRSIFKEVRRFSRLTNRKLIIWDIGANDGSWSSVAKIAAIRKPQIVAFEANEVHLPALRETGFEHFIVALGDKDGSEVSFYATGGTGDSIFRENTPHYEHVVPQVLTTRRLDSLISEHDLTLPDLIKIDTQGSELPILMGLGHRLHDVRWIYLELPITEYNEGAPSLTETIRFLETKRFKPIDLLEVHRIGGYVVQIDMLFENQSQKLFS